MDDIHKDGLVKLRLGVAPPETTPAPAHPFPKSFGRSNPSGMLFPPCRKVSGSAGQSAD
jgi:hypothetical protein